MDLEPVVDSSERLTRRGESFISTQCVRCECSRLEEYRDPWLEMGISATQVDRVIEFQRRWGGLVLPPSLDYEGGPKMLYADMTSDAIDALDVSTFERWLWRFPPRLPDIEDRRGHLSGLGRACLETGGPPGSVGEVGAQSCAARLVGHDVRLSIRHAAGE